MFREADIGRSVYGEVVLVFFSLVEGGPVPEKGHLFLVPEPGYVSRPGVSGKGGLAD